MRVEEDAEPEAGVALRGPEAGVVRVVAAQVDEDADAGRRDAGQLAGLAAAEPRGVAVALPPAGRGVGVDAREVDEDAHAAAAARALLEG